MAYPAELAILMAADQRNTAAIRAGNWPSRGSGWRSRPASCRPRVWSSITATVMAGGGVVRCVWACVATPAARAVREAGRVLSARRWRNGTERRAALEMDTTVPVDLNADGIGDDVVDSDADEEVLEGPMIGDIDLVDMEAGTRGR